MATATLQAPAGLRAAPEVAVPTPQVKLVDVRPAYPVQSAPSS